MTRFHKSQKYLFSPKKIDFITVWPLRQVHAKVVVKKSEVMIEIPFSKDFKMEGFNLNRIKKVDCNVFFFIFLMSVNIFEKKKKIKFFKL